MHLSSFQEYVFFASIYLMVCSIGLWLGLPNILVPPRRFAMAQLHFRAFSGLSLSFNLASHPQVPSGPLETSAYDREASVGPVVHTSRLLA